jgi:hypothetical protein
MNDVRWSDSELRKFVEAESHYSWFSDASDREEDRARFREEVKSRVVAAVQAGLLERVGVVTDPEGIAAVAVDLTLELCCKDDARRWLLVSTEPWDYLTGWITREIVKSYKATAGRKRPTDEILKEIERANQ